jgi:GNAT superfamily N-acetyltransferase
MPMDKEQLLRLYDLEERQNAVFYNSQREVTPHVVRFRPLPGMKGGSYILYSCLDENNADEVIRQEIAYFEQLGCRCEWKLYDHDQPADLRERLAARGFTIEEPEALMVLDLAKTPEALKQPILHDVRRITGPALIPAILNVQETVWAERDIAFVQEAVQELLLNGQHISYYAAYADEKPVCSAWIRFSETGSFASLWGGATLPEYRRRGSYTALLAARTQEAIRRGYRFLTIDASPMSRPIVERHGFQFLVYTYPCKWTRETPAQQ